VRSALHAQLHAPWEWNNNGTFVGLRGIGAAHQSLTYGHYNLVDTSLLDQPMGQQSTTSFAEFCQKITWESWQRLP